MLVVNFVLVSHPHEIVCIHVFRTANTCIYSNRCFVSDEMNVLWYFTLSVTFCLAFVDITHSITVSSCGIHLAEFLFLLTKENFITNQKQEANWQPNVWPFCFTGKNTDVTNKRSFFSILKTRRLWSVLFCCKQNKLITNDFYNFFFSNFFLQQTAKWMQQIIFASFLESKRSSNYYLADVKRVVCSRQGLTTNLSGSG